MEKVFRLMGKLSYLLIPLFIPMKPLNILNIAFISPKIFIGIILKTDLQENAQIIKILNLNNTFNFKDRRLAANQKNIFERSTTRE